jgi:hypothetical protein
MSILDTFSRWLPRDRPLALVVGGVFVGLIGPALTGWMITGVTSAGMEYATFPMQQERIRYIRETLPSVPCSVEVVAFQSLISEAVAWNLRIAHEKEANRRWYADPFSPDGWLSVEPINLPCEAL